MKPTGKAWWQRLAVFVSVTPPPPLDRFVTAVGAALAILAIGVMDYATTSIAVAVFYLLPVAAATIVAGDSVGLALCGLSGLVYAIEQNSTTHFGLGNALVNGALRTVTYAIVVVLISALRHLAAQAKESDAAGQAFLATAAHQLRTPVAGILASADALEVESDGARRDHLVENLGAEAQRIGRIVSALLRFAQLDAGHVPDRAPIDVAAIVRDEVEITRYRHPGMPVSLAEDTASLPAFASLDATREVLTNVLDNAVRHAMSRVDVSLSSTDDLVVIDVRDDGPGIDAGQEELVFARFASFDGKGGAGLGLAIARDLARAQGGDLRWSGGSFVLSLPVESRADGDDPSRHAGAQCRHRLPGSSEVRDLRDDDLVDRAADGHPCR
jgi:signal transduction histidine kinase